MSTSVPPPPNYGGAAQQMGQISQQNTNQQTANNRPGQNTGFGSTSWSQSAPTPEYYDPGMNGGMGGWVMSPQTWTENTSLNGPLGQAQGMTQDELLKNLGAGLDTGNQARDQATNAMYSAEMSQLQPQFNLANEQSAAQLANEGLPSTSESARAQQQQLMSQENQANLGALANAQQLGNQAQQITFGENVASQQMPIQELQGLLALEQQPGFQGAGIPQTPDILGAMGLQGQYGLESADLYNKAAGAQDQAIGSFFGSLIGAAGKMAGGG